jgi:very-short-patch-repair endonuclease
VVHEGHQDDRAVVEGIPVTTVARTLLDLAEVAPARIERALEAAERMGFFDLRKVEALMDRNPGRRGSRILGAALDTYRDPSLTRSELERRFLRLCRRAGLPAPATNIWIAGQEVDAVWCDKRLVVELDSHEFHRTRAAFERDRVRDGDLQLAGYRVLRVTHRRLRDEPNVIVSMVRSLLRPPAWSPPARGSSPSPPLRARRRPAPQSIP